MPVVEPARSMRNNLPSNARIGDWNWSHPSLGSRRPAVALGRLITLFRWYEIPPRGGIRRFICGGNAAGCVDWR